MPAWEIRDANAADADGIARVHIDAWQAAYRSLLAPEVIARQARSRRCFWGSYLKQSHAREHVLVAVDGDHVAGFATARPSPDEDTDATVAEVAGLYVCPDAWGRGVGTRLLDAIVDRIQHDEFATASLWVLAGNERARRFYEIRSWRADGAKRVDPNRGEVEVRYRRSLGTS